MVVSWFAVVSLLVLSLFLFLFSMVISIVSVLVVSLQILKAIVEITFMKLVVRLINTDIVKKTVMPKTLAKVVELFEGIDDRNESSDMVVRAVCVFPVLTNNKELRQLTAAKVTSEILTKRLKKSRNMLMIEAGEIAKILIL